MKKLMAMAAAMCLGLAAEAMGSWSIASMQGINGSAYSGTVNIYCSEIPFVSGAGEVANGSMGASAVDLDGLLFELEWTFYYTSTDSHGNTFMSDQVAQTIWDGTDAIAFTGNGTWTAVPEPTSAMLMLLGVAGLCLRRKQRG